jgi:hypothetical protein
MLQMIIRQQGPVTNPYCAPPNRRHHEPQASEKAPQAQYSAYRSTGGHPLPIMQPRRNRAAEGKLRTVIAGPGSVWINPPVRSYQY